MARQRRRTASASKAGKTVYLDVSCQANAKYSKIVPSKIMRLALKYCNLKIKALEIPFIFCFSQILLSLPAPKNHIFHLLFSSVSIEK